MFNFKFDPTQPHVAVSYLRMSSDLQNQRSPDQQLAEIERRVKSRGYPWTIMKHYRDDAKSGRLLRGRHAFQQMLADIQTGMIKADLILVDTIERFARVDDIPTIRKRLLEKYGVLVLTADTDFADPTTTQGKAHSVIEAWRATEDGRIKGHNVRRGKRDAVLQKHWPGGGPPMGYRLRSVLTTRHGREEVDYCVLEPDPETTWIIQLLFQVAFERGWGQTRLAKFLNANPDIPDKFHPFEPGTVGMWLKQEIYYGEMVWPKVSKGIVNDTHVTQRNKPEEQVRVSDFCEPLVSREVWDAVNDLRRRRAEVTARARARVAEADDKQIRPLAPGMTVKYLLTGLVRCGHCGRAMTPSATKEYVNKAGDSKRYVNYVCPGYLGGICPNRRRVPEKWLREAVVEQIQARLFPVSDS